MSFTASFWTFAKEVNSTAVPQGAGTQFSCVANGGIDIINPVISLQRGLGGTNSPVAYNYCRIPTFGNRYYFVENWRWENGLWHAYCSVDVLATYKTEIGNLREYVVRSAHSYDGTISDGLYPAKNDYEYGYIASSSINPWKDTFYTGLYVVGVIGEGATNYYGFTLTEFNNFIKYILSDAYVDDVVNNKWMLNAYPEAKAIVDPLQYIASVTYFPFAVNTSSFTSKTIRVGFADVTATCGAVGSSELSSTLLLSFNFSGFAFHPLASSRGVYLNYAPWTRRYVWIPPFGIIELDCTQLSNTCTCEIVVDMVTGYGRLQVYGTHLQSEYKSQIGITLQISQVVNKQMGTLSIIQKAANITSQIMGGITGGGGYGAMNANIQGASKELKPEFMGGGAWLGGAAAGVSGISGFIKDAIESRIPTAHSIGSTGGFMDVTGSPFMFWVFTMPVDESRQTRGRPLCTTAQLSTLAADANNSGYLLIADPDITGISATATEREMIKSFLAGGFYLA